MDGFDYDITDPGTRGLMMLQAFQGTFHGRDGLMEAYKLGELERAKRKEAAVQHHSMGLLTGMLSGANPQELMRNFPLADPGVMSNLVASKVAEDRAARARVEQEAADRRQFLFEKSYAEELAKKEAAAQGAARKTYESLAPEKMEQFTPPAVAGGVVPQNELGPTPEQPPVMDMGLAQRPEPDLVQFPDFQPPDEQRLVRPTRSFGEIPESEVESTMGSAYDPAASQAARKILLAEEKQSGDDTYKASQILIANGPEREVESMAAIRELGLDVNPTKLKALLTASPIWMQGLSKAGATGGAQGRLDVASSDLGRAQTEWVMRTKAKLAQSYAATGLPTEVSSLLAEVAANGGRVPIPPYMSRGMGGDKARADFYIDWYNKVMEQGGAQAFIQNQAQLAADKQSLTFQTKRVDSAESFVENLGQQVERVKGYLGELGRFDTRLLNIPRRELARSVAGSPYEAIVDMYVTEISNEIGKLSTDSVQSVRELSVEAQNKWYKIHDMNLSIADLLQVLEETKHAADMRFGTIKKTKEGISGRIGSGQNPSDEAKTNSDWKVGDRNAEGLRPATRGGVTIWIDDNGVRVK